MKSPFKNEEILDDGGQGGCLPQMLSILAVGVATLGALGYAAYRGTVEILALVG